MNENIKSLLIFFVFIFAFMYFYLDSKRIDRSINENKFVTIGKVYEITSGRGITRAQYFYFYKKRKYYGLEGISNSGKKYLNRYYKVEISREKPDYSRIFLEEEITPAPQRVNK